MVEPLVTRDTVKSAIRTLKNQGVESPDYRSVLQITGGSMTSLAREMQAIQEEERLARTSQTLLSDDFQLSFRSEIGRAIELQTEELQNQVHQLINQLDELCKTNDELRNQHSQDVLYIEKAKKAIYALQLKLSKQEQSHTKEINQFSQMNEKMMLALQNKLHQKDSQI